MITKITNFLKKILLIDLLQGLTITWSYNLRKKATIQYPEQVKEPAERFRGVLRLYRDGEGKPLCIACKMCQRACPMNCFDIEGQKDESNKQRPVKFDWKMERCAFCGLCTEACPTKALRATKEFRMASLDRKNLFFHLDEMYDNYDVQAHLAGKRSN